MSRSKNCSRLSIIDENIEHRLHSIISYEFSINYKISTIKASIKNCFNCKVDRVGYKFCAAKNFSLVLILSNMASFIKNLFAIGFAFIFSSALHGVDGGDLRKTSAVTLRFNGKLVGTGALINEHWVLIAAHCIEKP